MKLRTIAIILLTLTLAFGSTAFAKSKHHHKALSQKSHHATKLHHKSTAAAALTTPATPAAEAPQAVQ
jgi:hypothetical protein